MQNAFITATAAVMTYMIIWFIVAHASKRNDVADVAWGGGFIVAAASSLVVSGGPTARAVLVMLLVLMWGLRLSLHIGLRNRGRHEDSRYRKWREEWGNHVVIRSFFQVFILQGVLLLLISIPVIVTITAKGGQLGPLDLIGALVWATGFLFEAVGDYQLLLFKKDPANRGRIMQYGLWKYTRHPNYFGEVSLWWGIYFIALCVPGGWITIIGPVTITFLILGVSGIPMLEKHYEGNKEFEEYKKRTSAFFPMAPKQ
jgi:steroid 5-alpha reductase family enzyme